MNNLFAGCISGLMTVIASISYATLIFSGNCAGYLQLGITSALISATVIGFIVAVRSSSPLTIAGPDANISAIIALMATAVAARTIAAGSSASVFTMLWITLAISSLAAGVFLFIVGRFRLGRWIRFIPYPVVGGFLAGTGWLLVRGSFKVMCGVPLTVKTLSELTIRSNLVHWLPGLIFAIALLAILRRYNHFLIMPIALVSAILACHAILFFAGIPLAQAMKDGWLLSSFPADLLVRSLTSLKFGAIDPLILVSGAGNLAALMIIAAIVILLNAASVELTTRRDVELDHELTTTGIANCIAAPFGAMTGCMALSRTILNFKAGASNRVAGISAALLCGVLLVFGAQALSLFPRAVLGGLLLYLGFSLLVEWVVDGWSRLSRFDYLLVVVIIVIVAIWGFLPAVGIGLVIACMLFAINYSRTGAVKQVLSGARFHSNVERSFAQQKILREQGDQIYIVQLQGFLFFGTAYPLLQHITQRLQSSAEKAVTYVILDFGHVTNLDSSSILSFSKLLQFTHTKRVSVLFASVNPGVTELLLEGKCIPERESPLFADTVFADLDHALGCCEDRVIAPTGPQLIERSSTFAEFFGALFERPELIPRLMDYLERLEAKTGFVLFEEGAPSRNLYFVESGTVTASINMGEGRPRKRLRTMGEGTVVGEMGLYLGANRTATIVAEKESILYRLSAEALQSIERDDLELACVLHRFFIRLLANRLAHANEEMAVLGR